MTWLAGCGSSTETIQTAVPTSESPAVTEADEIRCPDDDFMSLSFSISRDAPGAQTRESALVAFLVSYFVSAPSVPTSVASEQAVGYRGDYDSISYLDGDELAARFDFIELRTNEWRVIGAILCNSAADIFVPMTTMAAGY